ncbi:MAG: DinB family protein [Thermoplasmata archaeon]
MHPRDVQELFEYLIESRPKFLDSFRWLGWDEFAKDRGASWGSMLAIFLHLLDDEEGWLQYAARGRSLIDAPDRKKEDYSSFEHVAADSTRVGAQTRSFLASLTQTELTTEVEFQLPNETMRRTRETIAMHAFVDELAHVGEFVCLLWQLDVKPPFLDWLDNHVGARTMG